MAIKNLTELIEGLQEREKPEDKLTFVYQWFTTHTENPVETDKDLGKICSLEGDVRKYLTYPIIGNWILAKLHEFEPANEYQIEVLEYFIEDVNKRRFANSHSEYILQEHGLDVDLFEFTKKEEASQEHIDYITAYSNELTELTKYLHELQMIVHGIKPKAMKPGGDPGHALNEPMNIFNYIISMGLTANSLPYSTGLTILVIDDQDPKYWSDFLSCVGFEKPKGEAYFKSPQEALTAIKTDARYDVILCDIELGKDMDGMQFAREAFNEIRTSGKMPIIALFSYNIKKVEEANLTLARQLPVDSRMPIICGAFDKNILR